jgi:flagellar biosynthesis/type III secretory pathway chaperone
VAGQVAEIATRVSEQADQRAQSLSAHVGDQLHQLAEDVQKSFTVLAEASKSLVESQQNLLVELQARQTQEREITEDLRQGVVEAGKLMRVNQSEFQASLEMFRQGVEALLDRYSGGSAEQEAQRGFIEQLHASLEAFSEKSSEVLVENAVRTQEILLEILEHSRLGGQDAQEKA